MSQILVIDDEIAIPAYLSRLITKFGYSCETAASAAEARAKLATPHQLVIADIRLPDNPDADAWIAELARIAKPAPVILISGMPTEELVATAKANGIDTFLTKPFELVFIKKLLKERLG